MLCKLSPLFFFLLLFTACDRENFDLIDESELPDELVEVDETPEFFVLTGATDLPDELTVGRAAYAEQGNSMIITAANEAVFDCPTPERTSFGVETNGPGRILINAFWDDDRNLLLARVLLRVLVDGEVYSYERSVCTPQDLSLTWEGDVISGSFRGEAIPESFIFINGRPPEEGECDDLSRVAVSADFRVRIEYCE